MDQKFRDEYKIYEGERCDTCLCEVPLKKIEITEHGKIEKIKTCSLCYTTSLSSEIECRQDLSPLAFAQGLHWLYTNLKISNWMKK